MMDNHCAVCGEYLADTGRTICEKCDDDRRRIRQLEKELRKEKPKEGRWEKAQFRYSGIIAYRCSECRTTWDVKTNYCPHCGVKMGG